jgi:hypothetical protein
MAAILPNFGTLVLLVESDIKVDEEFSEGTTAENCPLNEVFIRF